MPTLFSARPSPRPPSKMVRPLLPQCSSPPPPSASRGGGGGEPRRPQSACPGGKFERPGPAGAAAGRREPSAARVRWQPVGAEGGCLTGRRGPSARPRASAGRPSAPSPAGIPLLPQPPSPRYPCPFALLLLDPPPCGAPFHPQTLKFGDIQNPMEIICDKWFFM